jgi:hypothetical protein
MAGCRLANKLCRAPESGGHALDAAMGSRQPNRGRRGWERRKEQWQRERKRQFAAAVAVAEAMERQKMGSHESIKQASARLLLGPVSIGLYYCLLRTTISTYCTARPYYGVTLYGHPHGQIPMPTVCALHLHARTPACPYLTLSPLCLSLLLPSRCSVKVP